MEMNPTELSDAELVAQLSGKEPVTLPLVPLIEEAARRLKARNDTIARVTAALQAIADFSPTSGLEPYQEIAVFAKKTARKALTPTQPEASEPAATALCAYFVAANVVCGIPQHGHDSWMQGHPFTPAAPAPDSPERCAKAAEWLENDRWFRGACTKLVGHLGDCKVGPPTAPPETRDAARERAIDCWLSIDRRDHAYVDAANLIAHERGIIAARLDLIADYIEARAAAVVAPKGVSRMAVGEISLKVQAYGGARIGDVCRDAVALAHQLDIDVWFNFNGVSVLARPDDDPAKVEKAWDDAMNNHWSTAATR